MALFENKVKGEVAKAAGHFKSYTDRQERNDALLSLLGVVAADKNDAGTKLARETLANGVTPQDVREMVVRSQSLDSTLAQFISLKVLSTICKPDAVREIVKVAEEKGKQEVADGIRKARPDVWPKPLE